MQSAAIQSSLSHARCFVDSLLGSRQSYGAAAVIVLALAGMMVTGNARAAEPAERAESDNRPNILLIMADDVGIEGLGCYGGVSYRTPHLDQMAADGLRFTQAYSQPLCTPTRVQIMTGKYNHRNWVSFGILDPQQKTFGHYLQQAGYRTGIFGKWQLQSYDPPDLPGAQKRRGTGMHPSQAGFHRYSLFHALHTEDKGSRYSNPTMLEGEEGEPGRLRTYPGRFGEDVWVDQIARFFDDNDDQPTFVYYPMALPHWPFVPTPDTPGWDPSKKQPEEVHYITDMIEYMDTTVGKLMQRLRDGGHLEDTIVIFYSDNGTHLDVVSEMSDGRRIAGGKATTRQTGIHVPLIAYHPKTIQPGVTDRIVDASDFLPTLLDLADSRLPENDFTDGITFAPIMRGESMPQREAAFFWYDSRPGWDKEKFRREIFALNRDYKLYSTGRLFRLTDKPLEEVEVDPLNMTQEDREAQRALARVIDRELTGSEPPPLVNAYGEPEIDLTSVPANREETQRNNRQLLNTGIEVHYGDPAIEQQKLWIFPPLGLDEGELRPCVFFIHGGGWGGRPEALAPQAVYLQRRGYTTVSIHFRAPRGDLTPADTLRDARTAYRWIVQHADQYHIDKNKLVVSGGSAGGHLSLALSTIALPGNDSQAEDPVIEHQPRGMVLFNPVIDLVEGWEAGRKRTEAAGIDPHQFSPAHQLRSGLPPVLVLSGTEDPLITPEQLRGFEQRMREAGNRCEIVLYPGAEHGFFNYGRHENRYFQWTMWQFETFLQQLF